MLQNTPIKFHKSTLKWLTEKGSIKKTWTGLIWLKTPRTIVSFMFVLLSHCLIGVRKQFLLTYVTSEISVLDKWLIEIQFWRQIDLGFSFISQNWIILLWRHTHIRPCWMTLYINNTTSCKSIKRKNKNY